MHNRLKLRKQNFKLNSDSNNYKFIVVSGFVCEKGIGDYFMFLNAFSTIKQINKNNSRFVLKGVLHVSIPENIPRIELDPWGLNEDDFIIVYNENSVEQNCEIRLWKPDIIIHTACRPNRAILAKYIDTEHVCYLEYDQPPYKVLKTGLSSDGNGIYIPEKLVQNALDMPWDDIRLREICDNSLIHTGYFSREHFFYDILLISQISLMKLKYSKNTKCNCLTYLLNLKQERYPVFWKNIFKNQVIKILGNDFEILFLSIDSARSECEKKSEKKRIIIVEDLFPVTHTDMIKIFNRSCEPIGITGNGSFSEAIALKKMPYFELSGTKPMINRQVEYYYELYKKINGEVCEFMDFLMDIRNREYFGQEIYKHTTNHQNNDFNKKYEKFIENCNLERFSIIEENNIKVINHITSQKNLSNYFEKLLTIQEKDNEKIKENFV